MMLKKFILSLLVIISLLSVIPTGCVNNSEEELYGIRVCDTTNITWESKVSQILKDNCVMCHNANFNNKNVRHDTYMEELKNVQSGRLRGAVNHLNGYTPMPYQRGKLPDCELQIINLWIDHGAPEK